MRFQHRHPPSPRDWQSYWTRLRRLGKRDWLEIGESWARRAGQSSLGSLTVIVAIVTALVGLAEQGGWLEALELRAYDHLLQSRMSDAGLDDRLLIVAITETDLQRLQRSTPSDDTLALALATLEQYEPVAIGLDLYRDLPQPPGSEALQQQLQSPRLVAIQKLGESAEDSVPPPPGIALEQVGFNDVPIDADGVVRRALLFASLESGDFYTSFPLQLALRYFSTQGIQPQPDAVGNLQLRAVTFVPLEADSGGYQTNDAAGYQILLNYRSPLARRVTLSEVLDHQLDPSWVRNKIVLIGTTAVSSKDLFFTPYSGGSTHQTFGVEVHAQIVSQLLSAVLDDRPLLRVWSEAEEWLWLAGWVLVGAFLAKRLRHPLVLAIGGMAGVGAVVITSWGCITQALWVPVVTPAIGLLLTMGAVIAHNAHQARRQQQMVMTLLGQNTSKEIADALWANRDQLLASGRLPGQRLTATLLFTDIRGFSTISEQLSPEAVLDWLNEYLAAMTEEIQQRQGIINKFTGDGLLAVFGVPIPRIHPQEIQQDAYCAVSCALAMGDRLTHLNQSWRDRGLSPVQMRVGIFTGSVVVGSLGGKDRMEYGVIGDSVNIASRLESCAKDRQVDDCRILIAQETWIYLQDQIEVEPWGPMALYGKRQLVDVYRVLGLTSTRDRSRSNPINA